MRKTIPQRGTRARASRPPRTQVATRRGEASVRQAGGSGALLRRLSESAALPALVASLEPRTLQRLVAYVGVNDAGELMALASPGQLVAALDAAVWRRTAADAAETFDAAVFVDWLEAWLDIGEAFAAERLLALDEDALAHALANLVEVQSIHVRGFEGAYGWKLERRFDAEVDRDADDVGGFDGRGADELAHAARWRHDDLDARLQHAAGRARDEADDFDRDERLWADAAPAASSATDQVFFGDYFVGGLVTDEWDIVLAALNALWSADPDHLIALLGRLAASPSMLAVGDHRSVLGDDVARARELAQAGRGFVTPLGARAFLAGGAAATLDALAAMDGYDEETAQYFARVQAAANAGAEAHVAAGAAAHEDGNEDEIAPAASHGRTRGGAVVVQAGQPDAAAVADLHALLADAGIVARPEAALAALTGDGGAPRIDVRGAIEALAGVDPDAATQRLQELAYLANVAVVALSAGTAPDDARAQTECEAEAAQCALAIVALGLGWLQAHAALPVADALRAPAGAVRAFRIGWHLVSSLPTRVVLACAEALARPDTVEKLARRPWLRDEMHTACADLRQCLREGAFDGARDALTLLSLVLDADTCRSLRPVLDAVPRAAGANEAAEARWIDGLQAYHAKEAFIARLSQ